MLGVVSVVLGLAWPMVMMAVFSTIVAVLLRIVPAVVAVTVAVTTPTVAAGQTMATVRLLLVAILVSSTVTTVTRWIILVLFQILTISTVPTVPIITVIGPLAITSAAILIPSTTVAAITVASLFTLAIVLGAAATVLTAGTLMLLLTPSVRENAIANIGNLVTGAARLVGGLLTQPIFRTTLVDLRCRRIVLCSFYLAISF